MKPRSRLERILDSRWPPLVLACAGVTMSVIALVWH